MLYHLRGKNNISYTRYRGNTDHAVPILAENSKCIFLVPIPAELLWLPRDSRGNPYRVILHCAHSEYNRSGRGRPKWRNLEPYGYAPPPYYDF